MKGSSSTRRRSWAKNSMKLNAKDYASAYVRATVGLPREEVRLRAEIFAQVLARRGETRLLPRVIEAAETLLEAGIAVIETVSPKPLSAAEKKILAKAADLEPENVRFEEKIDETAGSGVKIRVGDRVVDATVAARLNALRLALTAR